MAINFSKVAGGPIDNYDYSGIGNFFPNILKAEQQAIASRYHEPMAQEGLREKSLANAFQAIKNQYAPESLNADIQSKMAYALAQQNGSNNYSGIIGQRAMLHRFGQQHGFDSPQYKAAEADLERNGLVQESLINNREGTNAARSWASIPSDAKEYNLATMRGMGYSDLDTIRHFNNGGTLESAAELKGIDPAQIDSIPKVFSPTNSSRSNAQQTRAFSKEEAYIAPIITDARAPYSDTTFGYSAELVEDEIKARHGDKAAIERVGDFYGSAILSTELALVRSAVAGGSTAHEAIKMAKHDSTPEIKSLLRGKPEAVFRRAQEFADKHLQEMANKRILSLEGVQTVPGNEGLTLPNAKAGNSGFKEALGKEARIQEKSYTGADIAEALAESPGLTEMQLRKRLDDNGWREVSE